jgi:hypothetical protein
VEELLPEDNENFPFPIDGPPESPAAQPFTPEQMVSCEECLRANPPTRVNCLYCDTVLPLDESTVKLQKPALRPLEKWERGYNNILLPPAANPAAATLSEAQLSEAADLLRLTAEELSRILSSAMPLPLARAATHDEASLVQRRLGVLEINTMIASDAELGLDETAPFRVRAIEIDDSGIHAFQTPEALPVQIPWADLVLLVVGRIIVKRVELKEQKGNRAEKRILDASEFFTDESVFELYTRSQPLPYRIAANSFDFSCLGNRKGLLAGENILELLNLFCEYAPHVERDESYNSARKVLEPVWPSEQQTESGGWRRERPGKYTIGSVFEVSNETQFLRYSRLRYFLKSKAGLRTDEIA